VDLVTQAPRAWRSRDELGTWIRHQLFLEAGSERDRVAQACADEWSIQTADGLVMRHAQTVSHGVVSWAPPTAERTRRPAG
jgi:hypothetical protein